MPQFGATFYPGGVDDYFMPEVVAPAPQRVMPEVPQNMQQDLQRMELEAHNTEAPNSNSSSKPNQQTQQEFKPFYDNTPVETMSAPSFSPFPKVKGDNIPPTDEAKEEILYNARQHVLHSNNVNMQLSWARDALTYVEIAAEAAARENLNATRAQTPKIEHELKMDAINIVNYLAGQDHPEALFIRSKWMEFGKFGRRPDKKEAYLGYKRAAEQGFGRAEYRMGMLYENSNDFDKAIIHYNKGLELNDSAAAYRLGMMNLLGQHSYRKDYHRGIDLIRQAAETADEDAPQGAYVYGMLISNDLPDIQVPETVLPYDATTAKLYIEKAAYLGFAKAQLKMGQAYELCQLSCDFNPSYSLHYYGLAARQGNSEAALGVSRWFLFGYDGYFAKNEQLAYQYAQQAANEKIHTGYFAMGYFYEIGIYVKKDLSEARRWYEMAADNGNKDARQRLDGLDHNQSLSKEDHETTGLGRIKSQHGSMRGKRPDRFKQNQVMPTLSESDNLRKSPAVSPRQNPMIVQDSVEFPDPERMVQKPPAFTINLNNQQNLPLRPSSAAPYPQDDRPAPLNLSRPKSTAPYPEDDIQGARPLSPHYNPNIRPSQGPVSDRPQSAFGIRTNPGPGGGYGGPGGPAGPGGPGGPGNNLYPSGPQAGRGRGGGWGAPNAGREPQGSGGYPQQGDNNYRRDPIPGQPQQGPPHDNWVGGGPAPNPSQNRLQKQNPNVRPPPAGQGGYGPQGNYPPPAGTQSYPARTSSRPASQGGPDPQRISGDYNQYQRPGSARPDHSMPPQRMDSLPHPQGGPGGRQPMPLKDRPAHLQENTGGRSSAPPGQGRPAPGAGAPNPGQRPPMPSSQSSSTINTTQSAPAKPQGQGPSTFEEMGIPKVKDEDNCVVM